MLANKKTLFSLLFLGFTFLLSAQVTTVRRYNPSGQSTQPQMYGTEINAANDASARRAAALSRVQGTSVRTLSAKGAATPVTYSTEDPVPVEYVAAPNPSTTFTVNGNSVQRSVRKGAGQVGNKLFTPIAELHYVQFAVYCKNTPVDKAPDIEGLMLLWHEGSKCPGGDQGACYIVKGYESEDEAKAAVLRYKAERIDCWYNPALTGAAVEVIGVRS